MGKIIKIYFNLLVGDKIDFIKKSRKLIETPPSKTGFVHQSVTRNVCEGAQNVRT